MKRYSIYFEALDAEGKQILGNLDGQGVILNAKASTFRRTKHYKRLVDLPKEKLSLGGRVVKYKVVDSNGKLLEMIQK